MKTAVRTRSFRPILAGFSLAIAQALNTHAALAESAAPGAYKIDPEHSAAHFTISHLGFSNMVGRFNVVQGSFTVGDKPEKSKITVEIPTSSIDTNHKKRDDHLKSADFFNVQEFKTMSFESSEVKLNGKGGGMLSGKLTLHGVTNPVTFKLVELGAGKDPWGGYRAGYRASTTIKRSEFGIKYNLGPKADDVEIVVDIEGIRQ